MARPTMQDPMCLWVASRMLPALGTVVAVLSPPRFRPPVLLIRALGWRGVAPCLHQGGLLAIDDGG